MNMCLCWHVHINAVPEETRRESQIPWSQSYRQLWASWHGCWQSKLDPLKEQCMLLTTGPFSSPNNLIFCEILYLTIVQHVLVLSNLEIFGFVLVTCYWSISWWLKNVNPSKFIELFYGLAESQIFNCPV